MIGGLQACTMIDEPQGLRCEKRLEYIRRLVNLTPFLASKQPYIHSHPCSVERIPVRGADTKTEQVGSSEIVSVEERWGRYTDWSSISHQDLHQNCRERIEGNGERIHTRLR